MKVQRRSLGIYAEYMNMYIPMAIYVHTCLLHLTLLVLVYHGQATYSLAYQVRSIFYTSGSICTYCYDY